MTRCRLFQGGICLALGSFAMAFSFGNPVAAAAEATTTTSAAAKPKLGEPLSAFSLKDCFGKERQLSDFADKKFLVLAFVGVECPLAKLYGPRLADLAAAPDRRAWWLDRLARCHALLAGVPA